MKGIVLWIFIMVFGGNSSQGQARDTAVLFAQIDSTIIAYRADLFSRKGALVQELSQLEEEAKKYNLNEQQAIVIQQGVEVLTTSLIKKTYIYDIRKIKNEVFQASDWDKKFGKLEAKIISINRLLSDMVSKNILQKEWPYNRSDSNVFQEHFAFFDISDGQVILDVGGGTGLFSLFLGMIYEDMVIGYNESDKKYMKYMEHECKVNSLIKPSNTFEFYEGKRRSTRAEYKEFDKVILIYTLHHFTKKKDMLRSIAKSLKNGHLYVSEPIISDGWKSCKRAISQEKILSLLSSTGYKVIEEEKHRKYSLMECVFSSE